MTAALDVVTARSRAESLMTSTCTISRPGEPTTDPVTGAVTASGAAVYTGVCRVRPASTQAGEGQAGGAEVVAAGYVVSLPYSVTAVKTFDRVTVTASPDAGLVGVSMEVRQVARGDHVTARRLMCEEVT